jgi:lysophospholipase L1-like esterase
METRPLALPLVRDLVLGLLRQFGQTTLPALNLVFDGNSIPRGYGLASPTTEAYPHLVYNALVALGWDVTMTKVATDGIKTDALVTRAAATVDVLLDANRTNMVIMLEGTNFLSGGGNAAQEIANLSNYYTARVAAGWDHVVLTTIPPWSPGTTDSFNTEYPVVNASLIGGAPTGRALFDLDAALTADGSNPATPTAHWQADKIHPSAYGAQVIAAACVTTIHEILGVDEIVPEVPAELGAPDLEHAINTNLVFFVGSHPEGSDLLGKELISDASISLVGSADFAGVHPTLSGWKCLEVTSRDTDGANLATVPAGLTGLSNTWTLWVDLDIEGTLGAGHSNALLSAPVNAGWTSTYAKLMWARQNSVGKQLSFMRNVAVANASAGSAAASFPTSGRHRLAVTRSGTTYKFYVDGAQVGTDETGASTSIDWSGTDRGLAIMCRHGAAPGEGLPGRLLGFRAWSRVLTGTEIGDLNTDPTLGIITE